MAGRVGHHVSVLKFLGVVLAIGVMARLVDGSSCPNQCSGHGSCVGTSCLCYAYWTGEDCSYQDRSLRSGQSVSGSVATDQWSYAHLYVRQVSTIKWTVTQHAGGDCDVYIYNSTFPTRSRWWQRDMSTKTNITITTPDARPTTWYIGIYGFEACSFQLTANVFRECPRDCSGHGICVDGTCSCDSGFSGRDCSYVTATDLPVNSNSAVTSIETRAWVYYRISRLEANSLLLFTLSQTTLGDADMYLQIGNYPNISNYAAKNTSVLTVSTLEFPYNSPTLERDLYLGIYGYRAVSFWVSVRAINSGRDCSITKCSLHGSCHSIMCQCNAGYHGSNCEYARRPLYLNQVVSGMVLDNLWNYYEFDSGLSQHPLRISVTESSMNDDCDLYVRVGAYPTRTSFDYCHLGGSQGNFSLTVPAVSSSGVYYLGVLGYTSCTYNLTVVDVVQNNSRCGPHGSPNSDGTCVCRDYYTGANCEIATTQLTKGIAVNGSVAHDNWAYYHLRTPANGTHSVQIHIAELHSYVAGDLWLYTSMDGWPTLGNYDKSDTRVGQRIHSVIYQTTGQPFVSRDILIGVFAGPYSLQANNFTIIVWYPDF